MTDEQDISIQRIAKANELVAQQQAAKVQADIIQAQVALEGSLRSSALSAAVALSGIHKYEKIGAVIEAAEEFLAWLRGNQ